MKMNKAHHRSPDFEEMNRDDLRDYVSRCRGSYSLRKFVRKAQRLLVKRTGRITYESDVLDSNKRGVK